MAREVYQLKQIEGVQLQMAEALKSMHKLQETNTLQQQQQLAQNKTHLDQKD